MTPRETWTSQCDAARDVLERFGVEKALGYLVGEKFLNFLEAAEREQEWRAEIPSFAAEIKGIFERWQLTDFFDTPRRLGALGHAASEEAHLALRSQMPKENLLRDDARNLLLLERARELLLDE